MPADTPKFAQRIDTFAGSLVRFGVQSRGAHYQAYGIVYMIHRHCERNMTDWVGNARMVDEMLSWENPPQVIAPSMAKAGLLLYANQEYVFPYLWDMCSFQVKENWRKTERESYDLAKSRKLLPDNDMPVTELMDEPVRDLFGSPIDEPTKKKPAHPAIGYKAIVGYWLNRWHSKYGKKYIFRARDGKHIGELLKRTDESEIRIAIDSYLSCSDPFYAGHELSGLFTQFNRWSCALPRTTKHGIAYNRSDDDLPTRTF